MSRLKSDSGLLGHFTAFTDDWIKFKEKAKTNEVVHVKIYKYFLEEARKQFSTLYAESTNESWSELYEMVLKTTSCELKGISIRYKSSSVMKKLITEMTDDELLDTYKMACKWTNKQAQVTGTDKNEEGQPYNHKRFMKALDKIEKFEDELSRRNLVI